MIDLRRPVPIPQTRDMTGAMYRDLDGLFALYSRHRRGVPAATWKRFVRGLPAGDGRGANESNVRQALKTLGLLDADGPTQLWMEVQREGSQNAGRDRLARHVILERGGWAFCYAIYVLAGASREELWGYYREHFHPDGPDHPMNISQFNTFLAWAGVSRSRGYQLDTRRFRSLVGLDIGSVGEIGAMPRRSRVLLDTLLSEGDAWRTVGDLRALMEAKAGLHVNPHEMELVVRPLEEADLIERRHRGHTRQKRGQHGELRLSTARHARLLRDHTIGSELVGTSLEGDVGHILAATYDELAADLGSSDRDRKGRALERLAVAICWRLGLRGIVLRDRGSIRGVELDITAERRRPDFSRVSVQCKNHAVPLGAPVVLKEIGAATLLGCDTVILFSTEGFLPSARLAARECAGKLGRNVVLLDGRRTAEMFESSETMDAVWGEEMEINATCRRGASDEWLPLFLAEWARSRLLHKAGRAAQSWARVAVLAREDHLIGSLDSEGLLKRAWIRALPLLRPCAHGRAAHIVPHE